MTVWNLFVRFNWETFGAICASLLAFFALIGLVYKKVVKPMWRGIWRTIRNIDEITDDLRGDEAKGILSLRQEIRGLRGQLDNHLTWHAENARDNGKSRV